MDNKLDRIRELTTSLNRVEENLEHEKRTLEFILENTTDGYWDWNIVTGYEYLSPQFKAQLGYAVDEMEDKPESWMEICHPDDLKKALSLFDETVATKGKVEYKLQARYTHKQGHEVTILCRGKVIEWSDEGVPLRMIGTHIIL